MNAELEARARRRDGELRGSDKFVGECKFELGEEVVYRGTTARVQSISKLNSKFTYRLRPIGGGPYIYAAEENLRPA